jgi:hypothetical protein
MGQPSGSGGQDKGIEFPATDPPAPQETLAPLPSKTIKFALILN